MVNLVINLVFATHPLRKWNHNAITLFPLFFSPQIADITFKPTAEPLLH